MTRKLLVFGGQGMLGHMLVDYFRTIGGWQVMYTTRDRHDPFGLYLEGGDLAAVEQLIAAVRPAVAVNAIGLLNEFAERDPQAAYWINGLLPHRMAAALARNGGRLIHISTDCVFAGVRGMHAENDEPDGVSVYARSKALGELRVAPHVTLRTSIVGPDNRAAGIGLLAWLLRQPQGATIRGYTRAYWNGVTTLELAKCVHAVCEDETAAGLFHIAAPEPVSKYELLQLFKTAFDRMDVTVAEDDAIRLDRTLAVTREDFRWSAPDHPTMLAELAAWMNAR
ncbi:SDR family oxidoreductase [Paenibacillus athensensis]|uniref:dTDP-4-dehydrorhamnose reductase n=1 Tax=Paenibacillus athensensis TaxID=1967502 RepID=A0A4Y8PQH2_9BACL|nr:SDR family oxidoreductase [Paenibacillus athensensis]MCD1258082.1 SDR family oxidoreductase [Paenibacillus athensensis]